MGHSSRTARLLGSIPLPSLQLRSAMLVGCGALLPLTAATVTFDDGRELVGEIVVEDSRSLTIAVSSGSMTIRTTHPLHEISAIDRNLSSEELRRQAWQARQVEAAQQGNATAMWSLAIEAVAAGNHLAHRRFARATLAIDPEHPGANRAVGNVLHEGEWMSNADAQRAKGLIWYDDQWLTEEEVAIRREDEQRRREEAAKRRQERRESAAAAVVYPQPLGGTYRSSSYSSYRSFPLLPFRHHHHHECERVIRIDKPVPPFFD